MTNPQRSALRTKLNDLAQSRAEAKAVVAHHETALHNTPTMSARYAKRLDLLEAAKEHERKTSSKYDEARRALKKEQREQKQQEQKHQEQKQQDQRDQKHQKHQKAREAQDRTAAEQSDHLVREVADLLTQHKIVSHEEADQYFRGRKGERSAGHGKAKAKHASPGPPRVDESLAKAKLTEAPGSAARRLRSNSVGAKEKGKEKGKEKEKGKGKGKGKEKQGHAAAPGSRRRGATASVGVGDLLLRQFAGYRHRHAAPFPAPTLGLKSALRKLGKAGGKEREKKVRWMEPLETKVRYI